MLLYAPWVWSSGRRWGAALALSLTFAFARSGAAQDAGRLPSALFYRGQNYGSESQFNPLSSFINYAFDSLQVPQSFGIEDFRRQNEEVWNNLTHPGQTIERQGGRKAFVNRQIFPLDFKEPDWIPNYTLHLLGGGMVYRKNAEWFQANGYAYPQLYAAAFGMSAEYLQEVIEKKSSIPGDELADFYLFRPAGMLLFSWDPFARFASQTLRLAEWPYQPMFNASKETLANVGENFIVRPALFGPEVARPFIFFGMTNLIGASHPINSTDSISWGIGAAVDRADPLDLRASAGLFYDRNDSLLASFIVNGTEHAARLNIYPGVIARGEPWSPGFFVGLGRKGELSVGLTVRVFPLGISGTAGR